MKARDFDYYVDKTETCWLWTGSINQDGYGVYRGKMAHRLAYIKLNGEFPIGYVADHLCRVRHCVRPDHLEAVTIGENIRRGNTAEAARQRHASVTHCPNGHEYTPDNLYLNVGKDGHQRRHCKTCVKARRKAQYYRDKLA